MSAYLVDDRTINTIVSHLHLNRDLSWLRREFMDAVHPMTSDVDAELGNALFAMNVAAVEARYGEGQAKEFRALDYRFTLEPASVRQVYQDIKCLQYQACEGAIPETLLFKLLVSLRAAVADEVIEETEAA